MSESGLQVPERPGSALRVLVVDDEPPARRGLRHLLEKEPDFILLEECACGVSAISAIERTRPDVVFLDVQMPGLSGFDVVGGLAAADRPLIVFVTAFEIHAPAAFDAAALDYLLKPVTTERFKESLNRIRARAKERAALALVNGSLDAVGPPTSTAVPARIAVEMGGRTTFLAAAEIDWVEADGDYVMLHCGARTFLLSRSLTSLLEQCLPDDFVRIHRSRAVNLSKLRSTTRERHGEYVLHLENGIRLEAGRSFTKRLGEKLRTEGLNR